MAVSTIDHTPALVVIDLQKGIVNGHHRWDDDRVNVVVHHATSLAAGFRHHDLPVILVNVTGRAHGVGSAGGQQPSPDWAELVEELGVQPEDHLISKRRRNAFHDTGLDTLLRDLGVTQIVLAGISTSAGVESTARYGSDYGYHVVFATDAMTDPDTEAHRHSIQRIFPKLGETSATAQILDALARSR
jgi:nicotinamidase-related amidase